MARPRKDGLDYFPHDTDASTDPKVEVLEALYGNDGYAFYFKLLERIYRTKDLELDVSEAETIQILSRKMGVTPQKFEEMLQTALKYGAFDRQAYDDRKVLTSNGIKRRAAPVLKKRSETRDSYTPASGGVFGRVSEAETPQSIVKKSIEDPKDQRPAPALVDTVDNPHDQTGASGTSEPARPAKPVKLFAEDSVEMLLAKRLRTRILENLPTAKVPPDTQAGLQKWCREFDLMMRVDKRAPPDIEALIDWVQDHPFWRANVMSPSKLREQFDRLVLERGRNNGRDTGGRGIRQSPRTATDTGRRPTADDYLSGRYGGFFKNAEPPKPS